MAEAWELIERLLEDRMTPAEASRFEALARSNREVCRLYLRTMNMVSNLPHYVAAHEWILGDEVDEAPAAAKPSMAEAMVLPAVREQDLTDEEPPPMRLPEPPPVVRAAPPSTRWRHVATVAAAVAIAGMVGWGVFHKRAEKPLVARLPATNPAPVALAPVRIVATAGAAWGKGEAILPGSILEPGRRVALEAGAVDVRFGTGSQMLVEGPAAFHVIDDNHAALDYGKLVAHVPPAGHGFGVTFGGQMITDLGTEFGLSADPKKGATVAVFEGQVVLDRAQGAAALPSTEPTSGRVESIHLTQGQAVAAGSRQDDWKPVAATSVRFARTLADVRMPIPALPNSGVGLTDGQADAHWQVYAESAGESAAKPAAMTTTGPLSPTFWVANDPSHSQWLSTAGNLPGVFPGVYVFRTTIDLSGFDPRTALVNADVMVDDAVTEIRLNGTRTGLSVPMSDDRSNWRQFHRVTFRGGFIAGRNTIDFVVYNGTAPPGRTTSKMGLRVHWQGDACPLPMQE
ncbi:MAG: hypothetical protein ACTHLZ_14395 [Tepidisphaeraceae bacterium]